MELMTHVQDREKFWFAIKHGSFREQEERPLEELSEGS